MTALYGAALLTGVSAVACAAAGERPQWWLLLVLAWALYAAGLIAGRRL